MHVESIRDVEHLEDLLSEPTDAVVETLARLQGDIVLLGVGGKIGSGRQYMSWVGLDYVIDVLVDCVTNSAYTGPVNVVAPQAVTNYEFTKTLGRVLHRPTVFPVPAFAAKLALGQMADELLLTSQRVRPKYLEQVGYNFKFPTLEPALQRAIHPWAHGVG